MSSIVGFSYQILLPNYPMIPIVIGLMVILRFFLLLVLSLKRLESDIGVVKNPINRLRLVGQTLTEWVQSVQFPTDVTHSWAFFNGLDGFNSQSSPRSNSSRCTMMFKGTSMMLCPVHRTYPVTTKKNAISDRIIATIQKEVIKWQNSQVPK